MFIPQTIGPHGQSYGKRYDFMQIRYSCQLLTIYSCAFISEGGFCRCVVLSYNCLFVGKLPLISQLTSISRGRSTIRHTWTRCVAVTAMRASDLDRVKLIQTDDTQTCTPIITNVHRNYLDIT